jgi:tetratricopeptide (TPR) repeat protein
MKKITSNRLDETKTLEELRAEIDRAKTLEERVDALRALCLQATRLKSADLLRWAGERMLIFGQDTKDSDIQADGYQALGSAAHFVADYQHAIEYYNISMKLNEQNEDTFGLARNFNSMGIAYHDLDDNMIALEFYERALLLNKEIGNKEGEANVTGNIGNVYSRFGDHGKQLVYYEHAILLFEELGLKTGAAKYRSNIGDVYVDTGDFDTGLKYLHQALTDFDELGMEFSSATVKNNIGCVYNKLSDHTKALTYQEQSFRDSEKLDIKDAAALAQLNMGISFQALGDNRKALTCFEYAYDVFIAFGAKGHAGVALGNIGFAYSELHDYPNALEYYQRAVVMLKQLGWKTNLPTFLRSIGTIYFLKEYEHHDPEKAEAYILESESLSLELGTKYELIGIYKALSALYEQIGKSEQALTYLKKSIDIEKEVLSEESKKRMDVFNMRLAIVDKELQAEKQKLRIGHLENQLTSQTMQLVTQTELLAEFRNELREIVQKYPSTDPGMREVKEKLKELPCKQINWEEFEKQFAGVHPEFSKKLENRYPDLTKMQMKMSPLLRLNLKSHEIARLFCITERAVEFHRLNIRKTLGLKKGQDLTKALENI